MSRIRPTRIAALIIALGLLAAACGEPEESMVISSGNHPVTAPRDIVQTARAADFTILVAALEAAGLDEVLGGDGLFTVFAPTDAAFGDLPDGLLDLLLEPEHSALLEDILTYHVAEGLQRSGDLLEQGRVTTLQGSAITIREVEVDDATEVRVGDATVTNPDQLATNGIIHVIDTVLVPPGRAGDVAELAGQVPELTDIVSTAEAAGQFDVLLGALGAAGLTSTLRGEGTFTVFAPTDAAFARLTPDQRAALDDPDVLQALLLFHVLNREVNTGDVLTQRFFTTLEGQGTRFVNERGGVYSFAGVELQITDIDATNGVIHVINQVLIPDSVRGPGGL